MSFIRFNTAEGGSNGITRKRRLNSGGASGYAFDTIFGQSPTYSTDVAQSGSLSYKLVTTSYGGPQWKLPGLTSQTYWLRSCIYMPAWPTGAILYAQRCLVERDRFSTGIDTAGKLYCSATGNAVVHGSYAMSTGAWYRIESACTQGAGVSKIEVYVYDNSGMTAGPRYHNCCWHRHRDDYRVVWCVRRRYRHLLPR